MDRSFSLLPAMIACLAMLGSAFGCPPEKVAVSKSIFVIEVEPSSDGNGEFLPITKKTLKNSISSLEKRLKRSGYSEFHSKTLGKNRISVELPVIEPEDQKEIRSLLTRTAKLELKEVHPKSIVLANRIASGEEAVPPGYKLYVFPILDDENKKVGERPILLSRRSIVGGSHIENATPIPDQYGTIAVLLTPAGGKRVGNATEKMRKGIDRMAIILDGKGIIAPTVQAKLGRSFVINGLGGPEEVQQVVLALNNPLLNGLKIISEKKISTKPGKE